MPPCWCWGVGATELVYCACVIRLWYAEASRSVMITLTCFRLLPMSAVGSPSQMSDAINGSELSPQGQSVSRRLCLLSVLNNSSSPANCWKYSNCRRWPDVFYSVTLLLPCTAVLRDRQFDETVELTSVGWQGCLTAGNVVLLIYTSTSISLYLPVLV